MEQHRNNAQRWAVGAAMLGTLPIRFAAMAVSLVLDGVRHGSLVNADAALAERRWDDLLLDGEVARLSGRVRPLPAAVGGR